MKSNFSGLSQQLQSIILTIPIFTPGTQNFDAETEQQVISRQEIFLKLPKGIRWKLASFDIGDKIELLGRRYGFELLRLANITRLIREYYFGEVRLEDFPREIEKRMSVSLLTAQEIARYVRAEIIDWDPWGEYLDKLPHLPLREILAKYPKIADSEITSGYIELKTSEDLEDPTIKNWIHDYVLHLGQTGHSQMERTEYLFHSENGQNLSSPDREKLGVILKSFDENTLLPVDEESGEIVFEEIENKVGKGYIRPETVRPAPTQTSPQPSPLQMGGQAYQGEGGMRPLHEEQKPASQTPNDFIKPFPAQTQPQRPTSPQPSPLQMGGQAYQGEGARFTPAQTAPTQIQAPPIAKISYQVTSSIPELQPRTSPQPSPYKGEGARNPAIDKFFNTPETPDIPPLKIHSISEHNEPRVAPTTSPQPSPYKGEGVVRPQHRIIDPFERRFAEPRIDGNVVDLSDR